MIQLSKNQKGFGIIELLIIVVVLGLLGFVGWNVYQKTSRTGNIRPDAVMYGYFDDLTMKVNSFDLANSQKRQLFEQAVSELDTRSRPSSVLNAEVSSDKQMVAYRFGNKNKVKIIKSDGSTVREIPRSDVASFTWLQNKQQLVLEKSNYIDCFNCGVPLNGPGSDWYIYDVESSKETQLDMGDNTFSRLTGQSAGTLYFVANSSYYSLKLYAYDMNSHKVSEVEGLPKEEGIQIGFISASPGGNHTIISVLHFGYGIDYNCTIYELNDKKLGDKIVDNANFQCDSVYWVNDNEFYFDKSTGPSGRITTSDNSPSGNYVLLSVFKYSFLDKKQEKVLVSDGSEVYRLLESLPDGSFVVLNEANKREPHFKLEIRNADGSLKTSIDSSQKEMLFIGTVK